MGADHLGTVLVTGATGFVGQALCRRLLADRFRVRGTHRSLDDRERLAAGTDPVAVPDIGPATVWDAALEGVDAVVHLAARVHVMDDRAENPLAVYRSVNVAGTERLARAAAASGVRRFVFASSVKVHGEGRADPYRESDPPAPEGPYGQSKWEAEQVIAGVAAESSLQVMVLRAPLVYGPGVRANFLRLLRAIDRGLPLPIGRVANRRSLIYLGNLVDALTTCVSHPGAPSRAYLVSDGADVSTPELVRRLARALGTPAHLLPVPVSWLRFAGRVLRCSAAVERLVGSLAVSSAQIEADLEWKPPFSLGEGLAKTVAWYRAERR